MPSSLVFSLSGKDPVINKIKSLKLIVLFVISLQRLRTERDSLKETIEELRCVQAQEGQLTTQGRNICVVHVRLFLINARFVLR